MIIGITGGFCSGKDTVADYLIKKGFVHCSLSDYLREELRNIGKEIGVVNLRSIGDELREEHGSNFLAKKALKTFKQGTAYVVSSIRSAGEVAEFKKREGFFLISLNAPPEIRFERMKNRKKKENEPQTLEEFKEQEARQNMTDVNAMQIAQCMKMADFEIQNTGTMEELYSQLDNILTSIKYQ